MNPGAPADLAPETVAAALAGRPVRAYPALLSTEADALAWARAGGPAGAVVVADYQAGAKGRAGFAWAVPPGTALGFSMVLRPGLAPEREGWLYLAALRGVAEVLAGPHRVAWPDEAGGAGARARVAVQFEDRSAGPGWAVVSALVEPVAPPRGPLLARALAGVEAALAAPAGAVLAWLGPRCTTLGRRQRARLVPMGPRGVVLEGDARRLADDGSLVLDGEGGRPVAVRPQHLGVLEPA